MKHLVIAEKPSVGRDIARVLHCNKKTNTYIEGTDYIVTWALGHLVTLADPEQYDEQYKTWNMDTLPMLPEHWKLVVIKQTGRQFHAVKELIFRKDVSDIIIATDAGREGELVARWILDKAGNQKPLKRLWISSVTDKAIREGFQNLRPGKSYEPLYRAAVARAQSDWVVGINATRALTCKYNAQLSCGRVQTPTLAMIAAREEEIRTFKPVPYYGLKAAVGGITFTWTDARSGSSRSFDKDRIQAIKQASAPSLLVTDVRKKLKKTFAPALYDLTALQREANQKFGFSAKQTLNIMQRLYENHKVLTYPRTDSRYLTTDIVPTLKERLKACAVGPYSKIAGRLSMQKLQANKSFVNDSKVSDHHAIIPTGVPARNLTENERKVYDLVTRRFIAAFYPDCEISTTTVLGKVGKVDFKVTGKQILKPGWRVVFGAEQKDPDAEPTEEEGVLPDFTKGESGPHKPLLKETWTTPPKPYTEATLLRAMETAGKLVENEDLRDALKENGIGRPSTRAAIIETLFKRNYIRKERKNLFPTATGKELIGTIHEELLKSAELTGLWEKKLRQIERGTYEARTFLEELKQMVNQVVINVLSDQSTRTITIEEAVKEAPKAEKGTKEEKKEKKPRKPRAKKEEKPKEIEKPVCPICKKGNILRGKTAYGCSEYKNGCTFRLDYATYGEGLSDKELIEVIKAL